MKIDETTGHSSENRGSISEMRLRHGSTWHPWRRTGSRKEGSVQMFELEDNEAVVGVRTNLNGWAWLMGLEVTTSTGRQISWGNLDKDCGGQKYVSFCQKRRSMVENAKLAFCSGLVETIDLNSPGRSITFHWIMD